MSHAEAVAHVLAALDAAGEAEHVGRALFERFRARLTAYPEAAHLYHLSGTDQRMEVVLEPERPHGGGTLHVVNVNGQRGGPYFCGYGNGWGSCLPLAELKQGIARWLRAEPVSPVIERAAA